MCEGDPICHEFLAIYGLEFYCVASGLNFCLVFLLALPQKFVCGKKMWSKHFVIDFFLSHLPYVRNNLLKSLALFFSMFMQRYHYFFFSNWI